MYLRGNLRVRLATQRKSLCKFNLRPLATTCRSVWPGLACTCVDLPFLWSRSNLYASQSKFFTVWPANLKPWPNWVASSRKLRTWAYLRLRLTRTCVHLRWLAMTCAHFGWDQICTQVDASFSPFGHTIQVNASQVTSINLLLANEIEDSLLWNVFICDLRVLARKFACPFGHPTQVSTQVQLASTCDYLRLLATTCWSVWPGLKSSQVEWRPSTYY